MFLSSEVVDDPLLYMWISNVPRHDLQHASIADLNITIGTFIKKIENNRRSNRNHWCSRRGRTSFRLCSFVASMLCLYLLLCRLLLIIKRVMIVQLHGLRPLLGRVAHVAVLDVCSAVCDREFWMMWMA